LEQVEFFKAHYNSASKGNYDIYVVFVERGLQLLRSSGHLTYICPHKFFNAKYGEPLRSLIAKGKHLRHVVHFGDLQVFPGATNYVCLLFLARGGIQGCRWIKVDNLPLWLGTTSSPESVIPAHRITGSEWSFSVGSNADLLERLQKMPVNLGRIADIFVGLQTSADTVFLFKDAIIPNRKTAKVKSKELDRIIEIESELLKPVIRSGKIGHYWADPTALVLFPYRRHLGKFQLLTEMELRTNYPLAWKYLLENKKLLEEREHGKFKKLWWQLYPKNLDLWEQAKILLPYMITELSAYYDVQGNYFVNVTTGGFGLTIRDAQISPLYVTALLNSRLLDWFLKKVSTTFHGGYFAANKQFLVQLPIRTMERMGAEQREFNIVVELAERIVVAKRANVASDTSAL
jgi:hypothetical protein